MKFSKKSGSIMMLIILGMILLTACQQKNNSGNDSDSSTVTGDAYQAVEEKEEEIVSKEFKPREVKDIGEIRKMRSWLEYFYYNNLFDQNLNNETGEISEEAMMSFAASYIMQLEHKGLRFDTDTFRLYIPQKILEETVMKFFHVKLEKHYSLSKHGILLEDGNYVIEAMPREWPTRLDIIQVKEIKPQVFVAILNGNNTELGEIEHQIRAEFQVIEDHFILKSYQMITDKSKFTEGNPLDVGNSGDDSNINEGNDNIVNPDNNENPEDQGPLEPGADNPEVSDEEKEKNNP